MNLSTRYSVNSRDVAHETIEDEVVIVNFRNGYYYSLSDVGSQIWTCMASEMRADEILAVLSAKYDADDSTLEQALEQLAGELTRENLVIASDGDGATADARPAGHSTAANGRAPFVAPSLEKFSDMENLLLVDPVHDVDDSGWPALAEEPLTSVAPTTSAPGA